MAQRLPVRRGVLLLAIFAWMTLQGTVSSQDLEPRRWTHLPIGANFAGLSYGFTQGTIAFDPILEVTDATVEAHTVVASYARWFNCFGKTARLDLLVPFQYVRWEGRLSGARASRQQDGLADPWLRLSVNLIGAPALAGEAFKEYRAANPVNTVVGAAVAAGFPLGRYDDDKLLNIGQNRFVFRPQLGVVHTHGPLSLELTGSVFLFTDNHDFVGGRTREQDPLYALQAHAVYSFPNSWWISAGVGYSWGGESTVDGEAKHDERGDLLSGLSFGVPIGKTQGLKLAYLHGDTLKSVGSDTHNVLLSWSLRF